MGEKKSGTATRERTCEWCGRTFRVGFREAKRRFCPDRSCASAYRNRQATLRLVSKERKRGDSQAAGRGLSDARVAAQADELRRMGRQLAAQREDTRRVARQSERQAEEFRVACAQISRLLDMGVLRIHRESAAWPQASAMTQWERTVKAWAGIGKPDTFDMERDEWERESERWDRNVARIRTNAADLTDTPQESEAQAEVKAMEQARRRWEREWLDAHPRINALLELDTLRDEYLREHGEPIGEHDPRVRRLEAIIDDETERTK